MTNEGTIRTKAIRKIHGFDLPSRARTVHAGPHSGTVGEPDIDAVVAGVALKVEVKMPGKKPTGLQASVMRQWARAGAVTGWIDHEDQILPMLEECRARAYRGIPFGVWERGDAT